MRRFLYITSRALFIYGGRLLYALHKPKLQSIDSPQSILLIRWDRIGDAVVTLPIIGMLKRAFPKACIDVVASAHNSFVFDNNSDINTVIVLDGFGRDYGVVTRIKSLLTSRFTRFKNPAFDKKYDVCIDMTNGEKTLIFKAFAECFIGPKSDDGLSLMYDFYPNQSLIESELTYVQYYQYFFNAFFDKQFNYIASPAPVKKCDSSFFTSKRKKVIIYIGGSQDYRRLSIEDSQEIINALSQKYNVYIFDDPNSDRANKVKVPLQHATFLAGYSLQELSYIARSCIFYIGAEGGVSHYLSSHIRSLVVFSPKYYFQHHKIWLPFDGGIYTVRHENRYEKTLTSSGTMGHMAMLIKPVKIYPMPPYVSEEMITVPSSVYLEAIINLTKETSHVS